MELKKKEIKEVEIIIDEIMNIYTNRYSVNILKDIKRINKLLNKIISNNDYLDLVYKLLISELKSFDYYYHFIDNNNFFYYNNKRDLINLYIYLIWFGNRIDLKRNKRYNDFIKELNKIYIKYDELKKDNNKVYIDFRNIKDDFYINFINKNINKIRYIK